MQFGYFTLSDNAYADNPHGSNRLVADIVAEALAAERLGFHSAWIGEHHFIDMVIWLKQVLAEDLTDNAVLLGNAARITSVLKQVEAAGFDEVILYFNVGLKPYVMALDEMGRFAVQVAPAGRQMTVIPIDVDPILHGSTSTAVGMIRRSLQARIALSSRLDRTRAQPGARASP
ncbi:MAG: LLM class flavin-dependent oxidoreductase [Acetobacteraceae bacterium]